MQGGCIVTTSYEKDILHLERFLPYRLSVLTNTVSRMLSQVYASQFNLTTPEWRVMAVVMRFPGLSAAEVAERTAMDKVAVSRAVARLLEAGRLVRRFADEDRRRSILELSPEGREIYRQITPLAKALEADLLAVLSPGEKVHLDVLLEKLFDHARTIAAQQTA